MRITIFPASRLGSLLYMAVALGFMCAFLSDAWSLHKVDKAFVDHGVVTEVLPVASYVQHYTQPKGMTQKLPTSNTATLSFHTPDDQTITVGRELDNSEVMTLAQGGTLRMQFLPESPADSARLEGHASKKWVSLVLAALLALYAFALMPTAPRPVPARRRG